MAFKLLTFLISLIFLDYYIYITEYFDFYGTHFNGLAKDNLKEYI